MATVRLRGLALGCRGGSAAERGTRSREPVSQLGFGQRTVLPLSHNVMVAQQVRHLDGQGGAYRSVRGFGSLRHAVGRVERARNSFEYPSSNSPGPAGDDIDDAIAVATRAREAATTILDQNVLSRW